MLHSMKHRPNISIVDMAQMVPRHPNLHHRNFSNPLKGGFQKLQRKNYKCNVCKTDIPLIVKQKIMFLMLF